MSNETMDVRRAQMAQTVYAAVVKHGAGTCREVSGAMLRRRGVPMAPRRAMDYLVVLAEKGYLRRVKDKGQEHCWAEGPKGEPESWLKIFPPSPRGRKAAPGAESLNRRYALAEVKECGTAALARVLGLYATQEPPKDVGRFHLLPADMDVEEEQRQARRAMR